MQFTKDSGLVKVWTSLVISGTYSLDQVPSLFNLKDMISEALNATTEVL